MTLRPRCRPRRDVPCYCQEVKRKLSTSHTNTATNPFTTPIFSSYLPSGMKPPHVILGVLPVEITNPENDCRTQIYSFLDPGASVTLLSWIAASDLCHAGPKKVECMKGVNSCGYYEVEEISLQIHRLSENLKLRSY